jgi:hypothetical protein
MNRPWVAGLLVLSVWMPAAGAEDAPRVYTNADLERFNRPAAGAPAAPTGSAADPASEWKYVQDFLDREYARIDADRRHRLEVRESDRQERESETWKHGRYWVGGSIGAAYWPGWWTSPRAAEPPRPSLYPWHGPYRPGAHQRAFLDYRVNFQGGPPPRVPQGPPQP